MGEQKSEKELATELTIEFYKKRAPSNVDVEEDRVVKTWLRFYHMITYKEDLPKEKK